MATKNARLLDDARRFDAVLNVRDRSILVLLPWRRFLDGAVYGNADHPMACYLNTGPDAVHSSPGFTTAVVAPGEVQDRYRNLGLLQTFGYPMFTLGRLIDAAEVLRNAGLDPYAYRGNHGQSIEMAIQYYACYGKTPGFYKTVNRYNASDCANHEQEELEAFLRDQSPGSASMSGSFEDSCEMQAVRGSPEAHAAQRIATR